MHAKFSILSLLGLVAAVSLCGCASPYHSDQGALAGGLLGAGTGAIVGHALGNTGAGAVIGAGVGALGGAAIGAGMDESEARNRAYIEQRLGRQVAAGATSVPDVVAMSRAGLPEDVIINHVRTHGLIAPPQTADLIYMQQQGVSARVIETMQAASVAQPAPVAAYPPGPYYYGDPPGYYYYDRPYYYAPQPSVSWGVSVRSR
jgi:hypothetical protein